MVELAERVRRIPFNALKADMYAFGIIVLAIFFRRVFLEMENDLQTALTGMNKEEFLDGWNRQKVPLTNTEELTRKHAMKALSDIVKSEEYYPSADDNLLWLIAGMGCREQERYDIDQFSSDWEKVSRGDQIYCK